MEHPAHVSDRVAYETGVLVRRDFFEVSRVNFLAHIDDVALTHQTLFRLFSLLVM